MRARALIYPDALELNQLEQRRIYDGLRRAISLSGWAKWLGTPRMRLLRPRDPTRPLNHKERVTACQLTINVFYEVVRQSPPYLARVMNAPPMVEVVIRDLVETLLQYGAMVPTHRRYSEEARPGSVVANIGLSDVLRWPSARAALPR